MLKSFSVRNYRSIKEAVSLSCIRQKGNEHEESLLHGSKEDFLPEIMILGTNGSGKTNLLKAAKTAQEILLNSNLRTPDQPISGVDPYRFDETSKKEPVEFEYELEIDGVLYRYGFAAITRQVTREYLYVYHSKLPSLVFEREREDFSFTNKLRKHYSEYLAKNSPNKLFLATAAAWNDEVCSTVYSYLTSSIMICSQQQLVDYGKILVSSLQTQEERSKVVADLRDADFSLSDIRFRKEASEDNESSDSPAFSVHSLFENLLSKYGMAPKDMSQTTHVVNRQEYNLLLSDESDGTRRYLYLIVMVRLALDHGKILIIDELENSLHPLLTGKVMKMFMNAHENTNQAQLIFTTHNPWLMDICELRRDQIYLTDRDRKDLSTDLYSLADFSVRKDENFVKSYMKGRFGAIPRVLDE